MAICFLFASICANKVYAQAEATQEKKSTDNSNSVKLSKEQESFHTAEQKAELKKNSRENKILE